MTALSCTKSNDSPIWDTINFSIWKGVPEAFGGGRSYIQRFKTAWVKHNRATIKLNAAKYKFPAELLAGVCWIEVGGDPNAIDRWAFEISTFVRSHLKVLEDTAIGKNPHKTSFGAVSIQLRTAADTLGIKVEEMSISELRNLADCLQKDIYNIEVVARHLRQLIDRDGLQKDPPNLTLDQVRIVGARYNRGMGLSLEAIKKNMSYGDFIVRSWPALTSMLNP